MQTLFQYIVTIENGNKLTATEVLNPNSFIVGEFSEEGMVLVSLYNFL